ncbi:hypothetical protein LSAT2_006102 [Lamellibrachia satsuma]|nr:hypothetical protein LSAT2_006102 [Lamellibrachia satsuma]
MRHHRLTSGGTLDNAPPPSDIRWYARECATTVSHRVFMIVRNDADTTRFHVNKLTVEMKTITVTALLVVVMTTYCLSNSPKEAENCMRRCKVTLSYSCLNKCSLLYPVDGSDEDVNCRKECRSQFDDCEDDCVESMDVF